MSSRLITAATFKSLESALVADLQASCARNPLAPKWVVTPTSTLANYLRVVLARGSCSSACAGARIVNLPRFAGGFTSSFMGQEAPQWNPLLDLTLFDLVQSLTPRSPLSNLKRIGGGAELLRAAFTDLAEGGFGVEDLPKLEDLANEPELSKREQEVLRLYVAWARLLKKRNIQWSPLVLQSLSLKIEEAEDEQIRSAVHAEQGEEPQVFVYGFYDWIDVNLEWIAALSRRVPMTIYYPFQKKNSKTHPAFSFAEPVLSDLRMRMGMAEERALEAEKSGTARFFLASFPEGEIVAQPAFLTHQRAAGVRAEVISAAVRIRRWLDEKIAPEDILVVAPRAEEYVETVEEMFRAFAIPLRVTDAAAGSAPEDETLRMLARIWEEQAPSEWVLALLRTHPSIPVAKGVNIESFESKIRGLGVWGGAAWRAALEREEFESDDDERGRRQIKFTEVEKDFIREVLEFVDEDGVASAKRVPIKDALAVLRRLRDKWLDEPALIAPLIAAAETASRHSPALEVDLAQWTRLLAECGGARTQRDPLCCAVTFVPLMRARGLTARAVVILGLAAGQLPFRVEDDPLLSEGASARLARVAEDLGHRLPVKARVTEEMLLLFFLINTAAERVHWVVPDSDASGREVAPTPWVQRYLQQWGSQTKNGESDLFSRRIPRAPFEQAVYLEQLDAAKGSMLPPQLALYVAPELAAACGETAGQASLLKSILKRGLEPEWSGSIGTKPPLSSNRISVTSLESLAKCPFRFYAQSVACWEPLEPLSLSHDIDALTRGTLLHSLLEQGIHPHLGKKTIGQISAEMLAREGAALWKLANGLTSTEPEAAFALAMLPAVFKQAALHDVVGMARRYFEWARQSSAVPQQVEARFHRDFPGLDGIQVVGKIDCVVQNRATVELQDYKSGSYPDGYRKCVKLGWQIQAALYPWLSKKPDASFSYIFLKNVVETGDDEDAPDAEAFLGELALLLKNGLFIPTSNQVMEEWGLNNLLPCRYCAFSSACRRFERRSAGLHAALFKRLAPERVVSIVGAAESKRAARTPDAGDVEAKSKTRRKGK